MKCIIFPFLPALICYNEIMLKKIVRKKRLGDPADAHDDLGYWLKQPARDRLAAIDILRNQAYGSTARLQRVARVIQRPSR